MSALLYKQIYAKIHEADHILLMTDERIDGDTLGSTLGMYHVLQTLGKEVTVYSPKPYEPMFRFLPDIDIIRRDESVFQDGTVDLVIVFDCSDDQYVMDDTRVGGMKRKVPLIVVDHHATNSQFGDLNLIETDAASTADVVWRFVKAQQLPMSEAAAQCILTGICHDTDAFSTSNTTAACLEAAHELTAHGAHLQEIVRETMMKKSIETLRLWGLLFERLHENEQFGAVCTALRQEDLTRLGVEEADMRRMINFLNEMLDDVDMIVVLKETSAGDVKVSMRAHSTDVASIAKRFGGGGHRLAAGFTVPGGKLMEMDGVWSVQTKDGQVLQAN